MTIPDFQSIMLPLLQFASDGVEHSVSEAVEAVATKMNLTDQERNQLYPSGKQKPIFDDRLHWSRTYLKQSGLLKDTRRSHFQITERGLQLLAEKPTTINMKTLERYPEYLAFKYRVRDKNVPARKRQIPEFDVSNRPTQIGKRDLPEFDVLNRPASSGRRVEPEFDATQNQTPKEAIEINYQRMKQALAQELLSTIKQQSPAFFERLVVELLVGMGYGGSIQDAGQAIGKSGDEGIDGIIKEDKLGFDVIYIQAKRWEKTIGRPEIQQFAGALQGQRARKGVFITTSSFTNEAKSFTTGIDNKIVLIDGEQLAQLMIDHNVGVAVDTVYELKRIDSDYFSGE